VDVELNLFVQNGASARMQDFSVQLFVTVNANVRMGE